MPCPPSSVTSSTTIRPIAPAPPPTAIPRRLRPPPRPRRSSTWLGSSFAPFRKSMDGLIPENGSDGNRRSASPIEPHHDVHGERAEGAGVRHALDQLHVLEELVDRPGLVERTALERDEECPHGQRGDHPRRGGDHDHPLESRQ